MQEKQEINFDQRDTSLTLRTQQLIDYLASLWKSLETISPENLRQIASLAADLPLPYKAVALSIIAEHIVNSMNLHFLTTLALFQQKAEQEGIALAEQEHTREDVLPVWLQSMAELNKRILVESTEDLINLSNITLGLQRLYQADSSEEAQRVLYELPKLYHDQLLQQRLLPSRLRPGNIMDRFR